MNLSKTNIWMRLNVAMLLVVAPSMHVAWAEDVRMMTWQECLRETGLNNPNLVSAKEVVAQSRAQRSLTKSAALPQINSFVTVDISKLSGKARGETYAYGVTAKQLIFNGFKINNDIAAASSTLDAAGYNYAVTSSNVRLNLRVAFVDLINAQQSLTVAMDIAARRKQSLDMITLQYQGGREHKGSLLTAQANHEAALYDIQAAKRDIALSQRRLIKAMGWKNFVPLQVKDDITAVTVDKDEPSYEMLTDTVPLLKALIAKKEAAKYNAASAKASFYPAIYANASAGKSDTQWPPSPQALSAGLSLSFPIFQGGSQQAELAKARAAFAQLQADERSGKDGVLFTLVEMWTRWQNGVANAGVQKKFLDAALERSQIAQVQYASGLITFNDWIIIEDSLVNAQKNYLSAQNNAAIALANWEQAKGVILDE